MKILRTLALLLALTVGTAHAAGAVRQEKSQLLNGGLVLTQTSTALTSTTLVGSTIEVLVTNDTGGGVIAPTSVQDSAGQTYTLRCSYNSTGFTQQMLLYTYSNSAATASLTVTATWGGTVGGAAVWVKEISGVGATPFTGCNGSVQINPGTGFLITPGAVAFTPPAIITATTFAVNIPATNGISAGFGLTSGIVGFGNGSGSAALSESSHLTGGGPTTQFYFSDGTNGASSTYISIGAAYTDGSVTPTNSGMFLVFP